MNTQRTHRAPDGTQPLTGVKVIDLSRLVSGNMLTHVLADLGATVVKVELPRKGDELRAWQRSGMSTCWLAYSRNKESVELNLRTPDDMAKLLPLPGDADILVENFRPGTMERMGLNKDKLNAINPRMVLVRISDWGQTGQFASKGGFGSLIEAMSGFAAMNGYPELPPVLPPFAMADSVATIYGAAVALAALRGQRSNKAPKVQEINLSLFEPLFSIMGPQAAEFQLTGKPTPRSGSRSPTHAPRNVYKTSDEKWIALSAGMQGTLARLFDGIGYPEGPQDPRFSTHEARLQNIDALDALIQGHILKLSLAEALEFFAVRDITAGAVRDIADLLRHPYTAESQLLVDQVASDGRTVSVHAAPYRINGKRPAIRRGAPSIGQDNSRWFDASATVASPSA